MMMPRSLDVRVTPRLEGKPVGQVPRLARTGEGQIVDRWSKSKGIWCCTRSRSSQEQGCNRRAVGHDSGEGRGEH